jgi:hypothetical protein
VKRRFGAIRNTVGDRCDFSSTFLTFHVVSQSQWLDDFGTINFEKLLTSLFPRVEGSASVDL